MTDIALRLTGNAPLAFDLAMAGPGLATDSGLITAIIISLWTDARARDDDELPAPGDRRGWWGDALPTIDGDQTGSRLWLLSRAKFTRRTVELARGYAAEALAWLRRDGIVESIEIEAEGIRPDVLALGVTVIRPAGPGRQRFDFVWDATKAELQMRTADAV